ncbi:uncharacterized protein BJ171DRAFT_478799 [Polychytrium aggregatum]|uniref:uncharacterized protein n=1 Tax=Polychytrium aggregatum TaxID=110093 RepID=UPI0022FE4EF4|nr:uncharacterized protein BJ171DRAFT_478799 [Polychytrium aggregatum]KAI9193545.1 hypothetical protein BJ171DRAFT_478799 [Polychytrium aggregatum]
MQSTQLSNPYGPVSPATLQAQSLHRPYSLPPAGSRCLPLSPPQQNYSTAPRIVRPSDYALPTQGVVDPRSVALPLTYQATQYTSLAQNPPFHPASVFATAPQPQTVGVYPTAHTGPLGHYVLPRHVANQHHPAANQHPVACRPPELPSSRVAPAAFAASDRTLDPHQKIAVMPGPGNVQFAPVPTNMPMPMPNRADPQRFNPGHLASPVNRSGMFLATPTGPTTPRSDPQDNSIGHSTFLHDRSTGVLAFPDGSLADLSRGASPDRTRMFPQSPSDQSSFDETLDDDGLKALEALAKGNPHDTDIQMRFYRSLARLAEAIENSGDHLSLESRQKQKDCHKKARHILKNLCHHRYASANVRPKAQYFLAEAYSEGKLGLKRDEHQAFALYLNSSKGNHPEATFRTARCYELGSGTKKDYKKAVQFYRKASALANHAAMYSLGLILINGLLDQQVNVREGIIWLKDVPKSSGVYPHSAYELALISEKGLDNSSLPDYEYAYGLYYAAAERGHVRAQLRLGQINEHGQMERSANPGYSIRWYRAAAEQGNSEAELGLAGWYLTGAPGELEPNHAEAFRWAQSAAKKGLDKAQFAMGHFYSHGIGVPVDLAAAYEWYKMAARQGNSLAVKCIQELRPRLPPSK